MVAEDGQPSVGHFLEKTRDERSLAGPGRTAYDEEVSVSHEFLCDVDVLLGQARKQSLALTLADTANAAALGDLQLPHDALGLGLAVPGQRLDERGNLHTAHDRVVAHIENLSDGELARLQLFSYLRPLDACLPFAFSSAQRGPRG